MFIECCFVRYPGPLLRLSYTGRTRSYTIQIRCLYSRKWLNTARISTVFCRKPGRRFTAVFIPYCIQHVYGLKYGAVFCRIITVFPPYDYRIWPYYHRICAILLSHTILPCAKNPCLESYRVR